MKEISQNDRNIIINIIKVFGVKGGAVLINLLTVPAYIRYFSDAEVLGVWYTIISILSWILTFDLGIGNGLRNKLVINLTLKKYHKAKEYISSAYVIISGVMLIFAAVLINVSKYINWNSVFNISEKLISNNVLYKVICIAIISLLLQFALNIIKSILYAMQESAIPSFLVLCTSTLNLIYAKVAPIGSVESNILRFSVMYLIAANLPLIICTIWVFVKPLKFCRPNLKYFKFNRTKDIMGLGGMFFAVQVLYLLIMNTNEFLITKTQGPDKVVDYQIYYKIFSSIGMGCSLALTPIWSAVTEAIAKKDIVWIKSIIKKITIAGCIVTVGILLMIPMFPLILPLWLGNREFEINYAYLFLFAILGICLIFNGIFSNIANGLSELKTQVICFAIGACIHIFGGIGVTYVLNSWIGMVLATVLAIAPYLIIQPIVLKRIIYKIEDNDM